MRALPAILVVVGAVAMTALAPNEATTAITTAVLGAIVVEALLMFQGPRRHSSSNNRSRSSFPKTEPEGPEESVPDRDRQQSRTAAARRRRRRPARQSQ